MAVKILNPVLGRLSLRFSRAVYGDIYNSKTCFTSYLMLYLNARFSVASYKHISLSLSSFSIIWIYWISFVCAFVSPFVCSLSGPLMLGAAASAFYINDAATLLPRSVVAKAGGFLAGAAADVLEVGGKGNQARDMTKIRRLFERVDFFLGWSENWRTPGGSSEKPCSCWQCWQDH